MTQKDIDFFLKESVFYPCSHFDGAPVKFLGRFFSSFLYADRSVSREEFETASRDKGFLGYSCIGIEGIEPKLLFGTQKGEFMLGPEENRSQPPFGGKTPFVALARFERLNGFSILHGPDLFHLMFSNSEAVTTYLSVFTRRGFAPKCLVHIRSGIAFGGNYTDYPTILADTVESSQGGLPKHILYDEQGGSTQWGDYLRLVEKYEHLKKWGRRMNTVTLGKLAIDRLS